MVCLVRSRWVLMYLVAPSHPVQLSFSFSLSVFLVVVSEFNPLKVRHFWWGI